MPSRRWRRWSCFQQYKAFRARPSMSAYHITIVAVSAMRQLGIHVRLPPNLRGVAKEQVGKDVERGPLGAVHTVCR